jgi:hypothetical protein
MGFLDKLKQGIRGSKEKVNVAEDRTHKTVDDSAEKIKRAENKAENAVDDAAAASDELKKD